MSLRIGLFGGTFNPVHSGHLILAQRAIESLQLDRLHLIPSAAPPHKAAPDLLPATVRIKLLKAGFDGVSDKILVDPIETKRPAPSYTADTVRSLIASNSDAEWIFLVGGDQGAQLGRWRDAEYLANTLRFAMHQRPGSPLEATPTAPDGTPFQIETIPGSPIDLSSSEIRRRAAAGLGLRGFTTDAVAELIEREGYYRPR